MEKIQERLNQLKKEKQEWMNKPFYSEGQREYHLHKIRILNTRIEDLKWVLNVL